MAYFVGGRGAAQIEGLYLSPNKDDSPLLLITYHVDMEREKALPGQILARCEFARIVVLYYGNQLIFRIIGIGEYQKNEALYETPISFHYFNVLCN